MPGQAHRGRRSRCGALPRPAAVLAPVHDLVTRQRGEPRREEQILAPIRKERDIITSFDRKLVAWDELRPVSVLLVQIVGPHDPAGSVPVVSASSDASMEAPFSFGVSEPKSVDLSGCDLHTRLCGQVTLRPCRSAAQQEQTEG